MTEPDFATPPPTGRTIRILSYNVHSCVGSDRVLDVGRIADVIAELEPDIIGLQELDVGRKRSGGIDQAEEIARRLKMDYHFHPALRMEEEHYGDALLTPLPMRLVKAGPLPSIGEPRGAIWAEVMAGEHRLQVFNTHLGLLRRDRQRQADALLGPDWIGHADAEGQPLVLIGDFNSIPSSAPYRSMVSRLDDARRQTGRLPFPTFPSRWPLLRLDHVFVGAGPKIVEALAISTPLTRKASDHLPLLVTIEV
ncbi:endonuclease/exonuclease/phosphatase family protein [Rhizobium sp. SSA_523]|uniref:endonuclease/exonuclease/phosphatase family protein n=1 Tax=Rhizobium sp. SSA_523 TaxID=2952477 RepID=UPI002090AC35|nr:endonuclease/exonuclease/phosphatase family protein [Rhizobium sp. SSA_523]MCO5731706.1 endonuclease/exonuclease/phosphatase family protein [Rhizobium sp. SSA_523]WKC22918.1 endonuclease/exonuclease/phosphatase family protein [Rhizobium sp. SSA_523]